MHGKKRRNKIICLSGIDGSGKTTCARKIIAHLQKSGEKCRYIWFGAPYFFSYPFMIICRTLGLTKTYNLTNNATCSEHQYYRNKSVASIWPWIQFIDIGIFVILRIYGSLMAGFTVVCDRFVYDNLVEVMVDINDSKLHEKLVGRLILKLTPKSSLKFFLDADEKTVFLRKQDIPNLRYFTCRRNNYRLISRDFNIVTVDAEGSFECIQRHLAR